MEKMVIHSSAQKQEMYLLRKMENGKKQGISKEQKEIKVTRVT